METKKISNSLAARRMAAFEKCGLTDCTFLVGPDEPDSQPQEIRAFKYDLLVASEYFEGLFRSPLTPADGPIRIKHVEPDIFKLVVKFIHLSGQLVTEINDLDQCLKLAAAADEFLLEELGQLCTEMLKKLINLDNVWSVFSQNHLIEYTSSACEKLLIGRTEECLKQPGFLEIEESALTKFLTLEELNIKSEIELVNACIKYVSGKQDERALFRRCALPHLRLLTLSAEDLSKHQVMSFLEPEEKLFLSYNLSQEDPLMIKKELKETTKLCKKAARVHANLRKTLVLDLFSEDIVQDFTSAFDPKLYSWTNSRGFEKTSEFTLTVVANHSIKITGFDIMCQIDKTLFHNRKLIARLKTSQAVDWKENTKVEIILTNTSKMSYKKCTYTFCEPSKRVGLWAHFDTSIMVPSGGTLQVVVTLEDCYVRNLLAKDVKGNADVKCSVKHVEGCGGIRFCGDKNIFKSLYYENIYD